MLQVSLPRGLVWSGLALLVSSHALAAQETAAVFDAPVMKLGAWEVPYTHVLDFDGDGLVDAFGHRTEFNSTRSRQRLNLWLGNGNGALDEVGEWIFYEDSIDSFHRVESHAAVGDFGTPDGGDEIAYAYGNKIRVYTWGGTEAVVLGDLTSPGDALDATAGDYDEDGKLDFAVLTERAVHMRLFDNAGPPTAANLRLPPSDWSGIETAELTGDSRDDVIVVSGSQALILTLDPPSSTTPAGRFASRAPRKMFAHGLTDPHVTVGDVDGDGDVDAVLFSLDGYRILRRVSPSAFRMERVRVGGPATGLADVDADGDLDGVCCGGGGGDSSPRPTKNMINSKFEISINRGGGDFAPAFQMQGLGAKHLAGAVDLDGDGDLELIAGRVVYYGDGPLTPAIALPEGTPIQLVPEAVHDLDSDGDADLQVSIDDYLENMGDGSMLVNTPILPAPPAGMSWYGPGVPGDFDDDGAVDFLVECWAGSTFQAVHLLTNAGGGAFTDAGQVATPAIAFSDQTSFDAHHVLVADLDDDGALDFAVRNEPASHGSPYWTTLWFNDLGTTGTFTEGTTWTGEWWLGVLDMDEDGNPEVVLSPDHATSHHKLMMRQGLGARTWDALIDRFSPFDRYTDFSVFMRDRLVIGDFWGDARPDIVTPKRSDGTVDDADVIWFETYGPGWLRTASWYGDLNYPNFNTTLSVRAVDVNADGRDDLVFHPVFDAGNESIEIWMRNADGSYAEGIIQMVRPRAFADVDGDTYPDAISDRIHPNRAH